MADESPTKIALVYHYIIARIEEPSTWGGQGVIALSLYALRVSPDLVGALLALGGAFGGILAMLYPEKGNKQ